LRLQRKCLLLKTLRKKVLLKGKVLPFVEEEEDDEVEKTQESYKAVSEKKKVQPPNISPELSEITQLRTIKFKGFADVKAHAKAWEMCSFSENKVNKFLAKQTADFIDYNYRNLSRIYPKGMRVDSSNYDPVPSWNVGSQIVALNYQTGSEPTFINDGKFMDNGRCGYILKPKFLREEKIAFNPHSKFKPVKTMILTVISAFQLPKVAGKEKNQNGVVIDPYVKIKIRGIPADEGKSQKTKVIKNNGFNPHWNAEFKFPLCYPDLAIAFFTVNDADILSADDFIGQYALSVNNIREGFRTVPLKDSKGTIYQNASLFVHIKFI